MTESHTYVLPEEEVSQALETRGSEPSSQSLLQAQALFRLTCDPIAPASRQATVLSPRPWLSLSPLEAELGASLILKGLG